MKRFARTMALALVVTACGDGSTGPTPVPPAITVQGVADGATYTVPVTINITVDRGSYEATLDGQPFISGTTVTSLGAHALSVTARNGAATATQTVGFTIAGAAGGAIIVRMLNLGPNEAGGGGDAILVTDSSSAGLIHGLVDAGPAGQNGNDQGYVARRLAALGVGALDFLLLTHAHGDHYQGMVPVMNAVDVRRFIYNGQVRSLASYQSVISTAAASADTVIRVATTETFSLRGDTALSRFTVIPPLPTYIQQDTDDGTLLNEGSLGAQLRFAGFEMFFTGDGEVAANNRWRTQFAAYSADVDALKIGHHGANNAVFDNGFNGASAWLTHTSPTISVISANGVTHPRVNALTRILSQSNNRTYCTNVHGEIAIRVRADGSAEVSVERNSDSDCVAGSEANT